MHNPYFLRKSSLLLLGALLPFAPAAFADYEELDVPFSLVFGMDAGQSGGAELLITPSADPFTLQWDFLEMGPGHTSAMAVVANRDPGTRFSLRAEARPESFVPGKPDDRIGFAVLGGPHDPPANAFDTTAGGFYSLTWSPSTEGATSVIEIREGFEGALLAQEVWEGRHPNTDSPFEGMFETYQLEGLGTYDATGALNLTFILTDGLGHAQSVSASIPDPREGTLFGFGGVLSADSAGDPRFAFLNFSVSGNTLLNERFADGERLVQELPRTSAWYGSPGSTAADPVLSQSADGMIKLDLNVLFGGARQNSHLITHFTDSAPVSLGVGETLRLAFGFQMTAAGSNNLAVRIGVLDSTGGGGRVTEDNQGTSHPRFNGYAGYAAFFNPNATGTGTMRIRERNPDNNALLSGASVWSNRATGGDDISIQDDTDYSGEILISRAPDGVNVTFSLLGDTIGPEATVSWDENAGGTFSFDTFAIWVNRDWAESLSLTSFDLEVLSPEPVPDGVTFAAWREENFPGGTDPGIIGPNAAPAGDGVANFLKYAFRLDPFTPATLSDVFQSAMEQESLEIIYYERTDAGDIEYLPQASTNLIDWESGPEYLEIESELLTEENLRRVKVRPREAGAAKMFLRVVVRESGG